MSSGVAVAEGVATDVVEVEVLVPEGGPRGEGRLERCGHSRDTAMGGRGVTGGDRSQRQQRVRAQAKSKAPHGSPRSSVTAGSYSNASGKMAGALAEDLRVRDHAARTRRSHARLPGRVTAPPPPAASVDVREQLLDELRASGNG